MAGFLVSWSMAFRSSHLSSTPSPVDPGLDKWRLPSQLQKAIRHGRADAADWAVSQLEVVDPNYLRYRLSVIAVEDVAAAQPELVSDTFGQGWGKKVIADRGGVDFLRSFARQCAQGPKDRLPCNWMSCTRWLPDFEHQHGPWSALPTKKATDMALDRSLSWWERGLAGWRAAGTKRFSNPHLPQVDGDWLAWKEASGGAAGEIAMHVMSAGEHQREAHPVFLGLAMAERLYGECVLIRPNLPNLPDIGPWLSATFDKHTSDGKRAYKRWLSSHPQAGQWLMERGLDEESRLDAVGRLAFWLEGGQCDQQWDHSLAQAVLIDTKRRYLQTRNMNAQTFAKLCVDPQGWHDARVAVVQAPRFGASRTSLSAHP